MDKIFILARQLRNYYRHETLNAVRRFLKAPADYQTSITDCEYIFSRIASVAHNLTRRQQMTLLRLEPLTILLFPKPTRRQICYAAVRSCGIYRHFDVSGYQSLMKKKLELFMKDKRNHLNPLHCISPPPKYLQEHVVKRKHMIDISTFSKEMLSIAFAADYRYFAHFNITPDTLKLYNKMFDYHLDKDPLLLEKLFMYNDFSWNMLIKLRPVEKYITAYPLCVKYFLCSNTSTNQQMLTLSTRLDPTTIVFANDSTTGTKFITAEHCYRAVKQDPSIILWVIKTGKFRNTAELKLMMKIAVELDPELVVSNPSLHSKTNFAIANLSRRRKYLRSMFDLCVALFELDIPDPPLFLIFDELYDYNLRDIDKWHITRIVKRQPLKI